jgi:hypothetical protein
MPSRNMSKKTGYCMGRRVRRGRGRGCDGGFGGHWSAPNFEAVDRCVPVYGMKSDVEARTEERRDGSIQHLLTTVLLAGFAGLRISSEQATAWHLLLSKWLGGGSMARVGVGYRGLGDLRRGPRAQVVGGLEPFFHAYMYMLLRLADVGDSAKRFSDWLWSMKAPRSAAMSISERMGISQTVR